MIYRYIAYAFMILPFVANADQSALQKAMYETRTACAGINNRVSDLKKMAGINTAVTGIGTVVGGVALGTGIAKLGVDKEQRQLEEKVKRLIAEKSKVPVDQLQIANLDQLREIISQQAQTTDVSLADDMTKIDELTRKSKTLGKVRTGGLAASTLTSVVGTAIASQNKVDDSLEANINDCIAATKTLSSVKLVARIENSATNTELAEADKMITACGDYEYVDIKPINKRATGSTISSGLGIATGLVGTITSASANTDKTRSGDEQREKKLNTTANVMSGASTAASVTATIFNASQISAIKKLVAVAEACEGALK